MFIVGTAVVVLSEGFTQCLRTINRNRQDTTLALLAQWKLSEIAAGITPVDLADSGDFTEEGYPGYTWSATVSESPVDTPGVNTVSVTVRREEEGVAPSQLTLRRLLYVPGEVEGFQL